MFAALIRVVLTLQCGQTCYQSALSSSSLTGLHRNPICANISMSDLEQTLFLPSD